MTDDVDIRALRSALGWTQEQLAEHLGLDRSSVSRMEHGQVPRGPVRRILQSLIQSTSTQPVVDARAGTAAAGNPPPAAAFCVGEVSESPVHVDSS